MRLLKGGLGQLRNSFLKLLKVLFLSQLVSPLVALLAVFVSYSTGLDTVTESPLVSPPTPTGAGSSTQSTTAANFELTGTEPDSCCPPSADSTAEEVLVNCPSDHKASPLLPECQSEEIECSSLPLSCLTCQCSPSCEYGMESEAECKAGEQVLCRGERSFPRSFLCSYCFLTQRSSHTCSQRSSGCRSVGSPTARSHFYIANCSVSQETICLGKRTFSKKKECNWTKGYSWKTALILSVTLGGFGADRFYLGHWQEGIGKLFSFGGLGVWTLVDVVLVSIGYIGPADGSLYI